MRKELSETQPGLTLRGEFRSIQFEILKPSLPFLARRGLIFLVDDRNILPLQQTSKKAHLGIWEISKQKTFSLRPHMTRGLSTTTIFVPHGKLSFMDTDTLKSHLMLTPCLFGSYKRGLKFSVRKNENVPSCISFL